MRLVVKQLQHTSASGKTFTIQMAGLIFFLINRPIAYAVFNVKKCKIIILFELKYKLNISRNSISYNFTLVPDINIFLLALNNIKLLCLNNFCSTKKYKGLVLLLLNILLINCTISRKWLLLIFLYLNAVLNKNS